MISLKNNINKTILFKGLNKKNQKKLYKHDSQFVPKGIIK